MDNKFADMPLVRALYQYGQKNPTRFHMPGHKGDVDENLRGLLEDHLYSWDVTEIAGLDDLHSSNGVIKEAQAKLAELYAADASFFLVNGATSGIVAMLGAALAPGEKVIVSRASHRSVVSGIIYAGAEPVYIFPEVSQELGVHTQVTPESINEVLEHHPESKAIMLPNITYQGFCMDTGAIVAEARKKGIKFLVDEAHGPHLAFSSKLPHTAGDFPVEGWVQSPHKMLTSLTQSAWLHTRGTPDFRRRVMSNLALVMSSSPSYILMASLDMARGEFEARGETLVERFLELAQGARSKINHRTPFYCIGEELRGKAGIFDIDLSRLMVNVSIAGYTGFEIEGALRKDHDIYAEYADYNNVYFLVGSSTQCQDLERLVKALSGFRKRKRLLATPMVYGETAEVAISPRRAFFAEGEVVPFDLARGRIAKEALVPYPPGIPLVMPGEVIGALHIETVQHLIVAGGACQGLGAEGTVQVVTES